MTSSGVTRSGECRTGRRRPRTAPPGARRGATGRASSSTAGPASRARMRRSGRGARRRPAPTCRAGPDGLQVVRRDRRPAAAAGLRHHERRHRRDEESEPPHIRSLPCPRGERIFCRGERRRRGPDPGRPHRQGGRDAGRRRRPISCPDARACARGRGSGAVRRPRGGRRDGHAAGRGRADRRAQGPRQGDVPRPRRPDRRASSFTPRSTRSERSRTPPSPTPTWAT